jgi:hypothetical protein
MVVAALISIGSSAVKTPGSGVVDFFHGFQVALMMTVMFNLVQFVYWRCNISRRGSVWQRHGPTFYTLISAILTNVQPMMILVVGSWKLCCAPCEMFSLTCQGSSYPPWDANAAKGFTGTPRPCDHSGNIFWDSSYCGGTKLSTFPSKASGWAVQILCTWVGFFFMFVGILQATQLHKKMAKQWRNIRSRG